MEKKLSDYLHLYLGCEGEIRHGEIVKLTTTVLHQAYNKASGMDFKPILRPLSDMTEEEAMEFRKFFRTFDYIEAAKVVKKDNGDVVINYYWGNELSGQIYPASFWVYDIRQLLYLLKQGFDLFGLIDAQLAIDKSKTP